MRDYRIIAPSRIEAEVSLPASKSISNRALILNALCTTPGIIGNIAVCDDTAAMVEALRLHSITPCDEVLHVNIGAAGTAMRFLTAFFATRTGRTVVLDGSARMRCRPISVLVEALRSCGAQIEYAGEEGFPPLRITGSTLQAEEVEISGGVSSQYISAMLMISPLIKGCKRLRLTGDIISKPYIDMTLSLMSDFGVSAHRSSAEISLPESAAYACEGEYMVESDWSAASYWYEMQSLLPQSHIVLRGLRKDSVQGDSAIAQIMTAMGVHTTYRSNDVVLSSADANHGSLCINLEDTPDLAQTIAVCGCMLGMPMNISGLRTLKIKETDRIEALRTELGKLGYHVDVTPDYTLVCDGKSDEVNGEISIATYDDHRMALSFAPASVKYPGIKICDTKVVSKSYPDYWQHLAAAGFKLEEGEVEQ